MQCPFCEHSDTIVRDSRNTDENKAIRRRRHCTKCSGRFTTFERVSMRELIVIKRTGAKRPFERNKILKSITTAVRKRNVTNDQIEDITNQIVVSLESSSSREIPTRKIGKLILQELNRIDPVAYIRFASVYKDFSTAEDFARFIGKIK